MADLVVRNRDAPLERLDAGRIVLEIAGASGDSGILLPQGMTQVAVGLGEVGHESNRFLESGTGAPEVALVTQGVAEIQLLSKSSRFTARIEEHCGWRLIGNFFLSNRVARNHDQSAQQVVQDLVSTPAMRMQGLDQAVPKAGSYRSTSGRSSDRPGRRRAGQKYGSR